MTYRKAIAPPPAPSPTRTPRNAVEEKTTAQTRTKAIAPSAGRIVLGCARQDGEPRGSAILTPVARKGRRQPRRNDLGSAGTHVLRSTVRTVVSAVIGATPGGVSEAEKGYRASRGSSPRCRNRGVMIPNGPHDIDHDAAPSALGAYSSGFLPVRVKMCSHAKGCERSPNASCGG
jgi:hypothetical protein